MSKFLESAAPCFGEGSIGYRVRAVHGRVEVVVWGERRCCRDRLKSFTSQPAKVHLRRFRTRILDIKGVVSDVGWRVLSCSSVYVQRPARHRLTGERCPRATEFPTRPGSAPSVQNCRSANLPPLPATEVHSLEGIPLRIVLHPWCLRTVFSFERGIQHGMVRGTLQARKSGTRDSRKDVLIVRLQPASCAFAKRWRKCSFWASPAGAPPAPESHVRKHCEATRLVRRQQKTLRDDW